MPPPFEAISKIWNFSSILSICLMLMCVSRIILDCIIITAVATGNVLGQLKRNTLLLIINSLLKDERYMNFKQGFHDQDMRWLFETYNIS